MKTEEGRLKTGKDGGHCQKFSELNFLLYRLGSFILEPEPVKQTSWTSLLVPCMHTEQTEMKALTIVCEFDKTPLRIAE